MKTKLIVTNYTLCLTVITLFFFFSPKTGYAYHVSLGRWTLPDCPLSQQVEIFQDKQNYAVSITKKDTSKKLLPLNLIKRENDKTFLFEEEQTEASSQIRYRITQDRELQLYLGDKIKCTGKPALVKGGSSLDFNEGSQ